MVYAKPAVSPAVGQESYTFDNFPLYKGGGNDAAADIVLDFSSALPDGTSFSRGSQATYVGSDGLLKTASTNSPRFHHDKNGVVLGVLVEGSRTNLLDRTEDFSHADWTKGRTTITANDIAAPDGTMTADKLTCNTAGGAHVRTVSASFSEGSKIAISCYVKAGNVDVVQIGAGNNALTHYAIIDIDLGDKTLGSVSAVGTYFSGLAADARIEELAGGWLRVSFVVTTNTVTDAILFLGYKHGVAAANVGDYVHAWGAQLEVGHFPSSYIKNSSTAAGVTRAADLCTMAVASWFLQEPYTIAADFVCPFQHTTTNWAYQFRIDGANFIRLAVGSSITASSFADSNEQYGLLKSWTPSFTHVQKSMLAVEDNSADFTVNAGTIASDASVVLPDNMQDAILYVGHNSATSEHLYGCVRKIRYWSSKKKSAFLLAKTAG